MDQKGAFNPSRCEITSAELIQFGKAAGDKENLDIFQMIGAFQINQSINNSAMSGTLEVFDNVGVLENLPLRGEETIILRIKAYDLQTELNLTCQIYKIDEVEILKSQQGLAYTLHWITKISYEASKRSFIAGYINKTASTIVKDIFTKYYNDGHQLGEATAQQNPPIQYPENTLKYNLSLAGTRKLFIEKTTDIMQLTIPDLSPAQAIQFVARRTFGQQPNAGSSFRWFETPLGFYFVSDEWLYEYGRRNRISTFNHGSFISLDPDDSVEQITSLSHFGNPTRVDVGSDMMNGAYKTTILEIDILKRQAEYHHYKYEDFLKQFKDSTGAEASINNDKHTQKFIDATFTEENARQYMIIRDYKDDTSSKAFRAETNFRNLAAQRTFYKHHAFATSAIGMTEGRLDISAGDVIRINTPSKNIAAEKEDNQQISGRFLVTSVSNEVEDGVLKTALTMFKYDWSDAGQDDGKRSGNKVEVST